MILKVERSKLELGFLSLFFMLFSLHFIGRMTSYFFILMAVIFFASFMMVEK